LLLVGCSRYSRIYPGFNHSDVLDLRQLEHLPNNTSTTLLRWPHANPYVHM